MAADDVDETDEETIFVEQDGIRTEAFDCDGVILVFGRGVEAFQDAIGADALRITRKTGEIEILDSQTQTYRIVGKPSRTSAVANIKPA